LEWPTLFQHSSIGDEQSTNIHFLFPLERYATTSEQNIQFEIETGIIQIIGGRVHLGSPNQLSPIVIDRSEESVIGRKGH
jgi:hypothetical protein